MGKALIWRRPPTPQAAPEIMEDLMAEDSRAKWRLSRAPGATSVERHPGRRAAPIPEPEAISTSIEPGGWTLGAFDEEAHHSYICGDIPNGFVKRS